MIFYWSKLVTGSNTTKRNNLVNLNLLQLFNVDSCKSKWLLSIKIILGDCLSYVRHSQSDPSKQWQVSSVYERLTDHFLQNWHHDLTLSTKGLLYSR